MLFFSVFLNRDLTATDYNYLIVMRNAGFNTVYTSLQLNIASDVLKVRLAELSKWCHNLDLKIFIAASKESLKRVGIEIGDVGQVQSLNINGLRIIGDLDLNIVAKLSKSISLILSAPAITKEKLLKLEEYNAAFDHLIAGYDFYPQPETGLDLSWFKAKNRKVKAANLKIAAFIPGKGGTPTLERERGINPFAAFLELQQLNCDYFIVADLFLKNDTIISFTNYLKKNAITLHINQEITELIGNTWCTRSDVARDVIRLKKSVQFSVATLQESKPRLIGTITCDNEQSTYQGELKIMRRNLPATKNSNVVGKIISEDCSLLKFIGSDQRIIFDQSTPD